MTWVSLESEMLAAAAYHVEKQTLYLRFRTGDVYRYFDFPAPKYQTLLGAESKGRFFLANIRNQFRYERLAKLQAA